MKNEEVAKTITAARRLYQIYEKVNARGSEPMISTTGTVSLYGYRCLGLVKAVNLTMYGRNALEWQVDDAMQLFRERLLSMGADAATGVHLMPLSPTPGYSDPALMVYGTAWQRDTENAEPKLSDDDFLWDDGVAS